MCQGRYKDEHLYFQMATDVQRAYAATCSPIALSFPQCFRLNTVFNYYCAKYLKISEFFIHLCQCCLKAGIQNRIPFIFCNGCMYSRMPLLLYVNECFYVYLFHSPQWKGRISQYLGAYIMECRWPFETTPLSSASLVRDSFYVVSPNHANK